LRKFVAGGESRDPSPKIALPLGRPIG